MSVEVDYIDKSFPYTITIYSSHQQSDKAILEWDVIDINIGNNCLCGLYMDHQVTIKNRETECIIRTKLENIIHMDPIQ